jgi:hypothetical protein
MRDFKITDARGGAAISVKIVPKANKTEIVGILDDGTIKIRLMSPPVDDQANDELITYLAEFLGCQPGDIEIVAGLEGRSKLVSIINVDARAVEEKIRGVAARIDE